jgi:hypothetical protein
MFKYVDFLNFTARNYVFFAVFCVLNDKYIDYRLENEHRKKTKKITGGKPIESKYNENITI